MSLDFLLWIFVLVLGFGLLISLVMALFVFGGPSLNIFKYISNPFLLDGYDNLSASTSLYMFKVFFRMF